MAEVLKFDMWNDFFKPTSGMRRVSFFSQSCKLSLSARLDFTKEQQCAQLTKSHIE